jgi:hypothetical protein
MKSRTNNDEWRKLTTYNVNEKAVCDIHHCKMIQVPCTMFVFCRKCENEKMRNEKEGYNNFEEI